MEFSDMVLGLLFSALLVLLALLDCRYLLIYDKLVLALLVLGILPLLLGRISWEDACRGAVLGGGFLGGLRLMVPGGMGWGDIKLAVVLGSWLGLAGMAVCFYVAFISGGLYGFWVWLRRGTVKHILIPFGPFLALGAVVAFVAGSSCAGLLEAWLWNP
ncbi:prepilin peptidase [Selenomonas ruminantium]|nr:A24 family peptidase [Selenomonas ruminantium]